MKALRRFWQRLDVDLRDLHAYGGLALLTWGFWQIFPPLAFVVCGLVLIVYALRTPG